MRNGFIKRADFMGYYKWYTNLTIPEKRVSTTVVKSKPCHINSITVGLRLYLATRLPRTIISETMVSMEVAEAR